MNPRLKNAIDARQTKEWGEYLKGIGWQYTLIEKTVIFYRKFPLLPVSVIKIQHPIGPIPFKKIEVFAKKINAMFVLIEPHCNGYDETTYKQHGYELSNMRFVHSATIKIDLTVSEEKLFKSFSENAKRNIKKAQQNDIGIKLVSMEKGIDKKWFDEMFQLLSTLGSMKKFYVASYDEYYKKLHAFHKTSFFLFALDKATKKPIAMVWYTYFDKVISYVQTGITQKGYDLLANYLLVWEGMKIAKKKKLHVFDFETAYDSRYHRTNKRWIGYTAFKKRFHGEFIEYPPSWIKFYNKPFKWLYAIASFISRGDL